MNDYEFDTQIQRVKASFPKFADGMIDEVRRRWKDLDAQLFMRMVSWVIDHSRFAPVQKNFFDAHQENLSSWKSETKANDCAECDGLYFVYTYALVYDEPKELVKPCPVCNHHKPKRTKTEQIQITREEYLKTHKHPIGQMGSHGARFALDLMDQHGTHGTSEEDLQKLAYKAAEHKKSQCSHCRRGNSPSITKAVATFNTT